VLISEQKTAHTLDPAEQEVIATAGNEQRADLIGDLVQNGFRGGKTPRKAIIHSMTEFGACQEWPRRSGTTAACERRRCQ
jgi:hypothetical protein